MIEIDLVEQAAEVKGDTAPANPPSQPAPTPTPPMPQAEAGEPSPPPPPPAPKSRPGPTSPPAVNLGGAAQDQDPLLVTGPNVVPPRPDATVHNRPPSYPADAGRRGAQGVVRLIIHVTESGAVAWVDVAQSSGDPSLDQAARNAVALWRWQPARQGGVPVPFDYEQTFEFTIGNR